MFGKVSAQLMMRQETRHPLLNREQIAIEGGGEANEAVYHISVRFSCRFGYWLHLGQQSEGSEAEG